MEEKNQMKKGISLIVLVITIIIMIILAAAVILSLNSSNVVSKASEAQSKSDIANAKNVVAMATAEWKLMSAEEQKNTYNDSFSKYAGDKLQEAGYAVEDTAGAYEVTDEGDVYVYPKIPDGFTVSTIPGETTVAGGLVIYEKPAGGAVDFADVNTAKSTYNQYVWIPVEGELQRYEWNKGASITETDETIPEEITNSIKVNGGFYIARYEAGLPSEITYDTANYGQTKGASLTKPVSKKGAIVWNNIPWGANNIYTNPGCALVSNKAYENTHISSVKSHLIYGAEWDAALKFI